MPNRDKLSELAAILMADLEDAQSIAFMAQQPDIRLEQAVERFEALRIKLREIDNNMSLAERLIAQLLQT